MDKALARNEQLRLILDTAVDGIVAIDERGVVRVFNRAAERIFGYEAGEVIGRNVSMLMPEPDASRHDGYIRNYIETGEARIIGSGREVEGLRRDGTVFPMELSVGASRVQGEWLFIGVVRDITERRAAQEELERHRRQLEELVQRRTSELEAANRRLRELAMEDALTGVANRRHFDETLPREIRRAVRQRRRLALLFADLDSFKAYNDRHGHSAGDACLRRVAGALSGVFERGADFVARYGGEEFAVILPGADTDEAVRQAERMRAAVRELAIPNPGPTGDLMTLSVGLISLFPGRHTESVDLVDTADAALYEAKRQGRNRVVAAGEEAA